MISQLVVYRPETTRQQAISDYGVVWFVQQSCHPKYPIQISGNLMYFAKFIDSTEAKCN
jgi:hypothetical protein